MALQELNRATTTDFTNQVEDFIVNAKALDAASPQQEESYWYFDKATTNFGYYLNIPEIFSAANALCTWTTGRGYTTEDKKMQVQLEHVSGQGKDTFEQVMWNHELVKIVVGDAFMEIKRGKTGIIVNMVPISPERLRRS